MNPEPQPGQARLPEHLEEAQLRYLMPGESTWTYPWAMRVDDQRHCWLDPTMTRHDRRHGTASMKVTRTEDGQLHVDVTHVTDPSWTADVGGQGVVGGCRPDQLLPIHHVAGADQHT